MSVTVVMPVHDKAPHLERSIGSVLAQTAGDLELIVVDDASTDGSLEIALAVADPRVRVLRRDTPGPGGYLARNLGVDAASHPWVCFLDADDEWHPDYLATVADLRARHPGVELVATGCGEGTVADAPTWSSGPSHVTSSPFGLIDYLGDQRILNTICVSMSVELFRRAGGYPTDPAATRGGDIDTYLRCLWRARSCVRTDQVLAFYYRDTTNRVTDLRRDARPVIPALASLDRIRAEADDPDLVAAVDRFRTALIHTRLSRAVAMGLPLDLGLLRRMEPSVYGLSRAGALLVRRARVRLDPRRRPRSRP